MGAVLLPFLMALPGVLGKWQGSWRPRLGSLFQVLLPLGQAENALGRPQLVDRGLAWAKETAGV